MGTDGGAMAVLNMWRVLQLIPGLNSSALLRRVVEGIVQSAAVYSIASAILVVTLLKSPNVGYVVCLNIFPALIVSLLCLADFALWFELTPLGLSFLDHCD